MACLMPVAYAAVGLVLTGFEAPLDMELVTRRSADAGDDAVHEEVADDIRLQLGDRAEFSVE